MGLGDSSRDTLLERFAKKMVDSAKTKTPIITSPPLGGVDPLAGIGLPHGIMVIDDPHPAMSFGPGASFATGTFFPGIAEALHSEPLYLDLEAPANAATRLAIRRLAIGDDNEIDPEDFNMTIGAFISEYRDIFVVNLETITTHTGLRDPIGRDLLTWPELRERFG